MDFNCLNCGKLVLEKSFGTKNRNHCPFCLYSLHVDNSPGDRKSECRELMEPVGLTFKKEGVDKYGKERQGEIMLIHKCIECGHVNINRIAGDDDSEMILKIFEKGKDLEDIGDIHVLKTGEERENAVVQLYGKV